MIITSSENQNSNTQDTSLLPNVEVDRVLGKAFTEASSRAKAFYGREGLLAASANSYDLDLRRFLEISTKGKYILSSFKRDKRLSSKSRNILVDIIISGLLQQDW